jgi:6-pyruvoyltetrahydropterin/6-carboxytetrahydropterin synthase
MYYITTEASFDAAHFLKNYKGKCRNIHGHRWKILVRIKTSTLLEDTQNEGMVTDFKDLKKDLSEIADRFDHTFIYEKDSLKPELLKLLKEEGFAMSEVDFRPTAENFSRFIYEEMQKKGYQLAEATVYETPKNCASYDGEE